MKTFSIGFDEKEFDELPYARHGRRSATRTDHHEFVVRPDAVEIFPKLVWHYNEPFADASAIPTYYLSRAGAPARHRGAQRRRRRRELRRLPALHAAPRRRSASIGCRRRCAGPSAAWRGAAPAPGRSDSVMYRGRQWLRRLSDTPAGRYARRVMIFEPEHQGRDLRAGVSGGAPATTATPRLLLDAFDASDAARFRRRAARRRRELLPERLPAREGGHRDDGARARRAVADARSRVHGVCREPAGRPEAARRAPRSTSSRRPCATCVPADIIDRPKKGFGVPLDALVPERAAGDERRPAARRPPAPQRGYFKPGAVQRLLEEHWRGTASWHDQLWTLLMLESWHRMFIDERPSAAPSAPLSGGGRSLNEDCDLRSGLRRLGVGGLPGRGRTRRHRRGRRRAQAGADPPGPLAGHRARPRRAARPHGRRRAG